jgi:hypothetical protein
MYPDSEILFPTRCILQLRDMRGNAWQQLVEHVTLLPSNHEEVLAFGLMLIKLGSCLTCDLDSYRASLGCCTCAQRTIRGFKGDDDELLERYQEFLVKVQTYVNGNGDGELPRAVTLMLKEKCPIEFDQG